MKFGKGGEVKGGRRDVKAIEVLQGENTEDVFDPEKEVPDRIKKFWLEMYNQSKMDTALEDAFYLALIFPAHSGELELIRLLNEFQGTEISAKNAVYLSFLFPYKMHEIKQVGPVYQEEPPPHTTDIDWITYVKLFYPEKRSSTRERALKEKLKESILFFNEGALRLEDSGLLFLLLIQFKLLFPEDTAEVVTGEELERIKKIIRAGLHEGLFKPPLKLGTAMLNLLQAERVTVEPNKGIQVEWRRGSLSKASPLPERPIHYM